ncbi:MAG: Ig-like domain-containing protein [Muribaculaceae bacterium]
MEKTTYFILVTLLGLMLYSCASIGRPTGGKIDELPPTFVKSNPLPNALNVTKNRIEIEFDELIQLKDQNDKVVVSPVQKEMASIRAQGRKVVIEFRDTMQANTTYSIDFGDAIQDFNEGNPIDGFAYAFSTGDHLDSLQISGMVLNARDLEPQQKILVGIHSNLEDSAFNKVPFARVARTNDYGQFTIRNLKPGRYHIFALGDNNRDYKFDNPLENIAFYNEIIVPSAVTKEVKDTIFTAKHEIDTIVDAKHATYLPNDILLSMFNEEFKSQYLIKNEREDKRRLYLEFAAQSDTLPILKLLNYDTNGKDWYKLDRSMHNDTLHYWISDTALMAKDSITVAATYFRTDTTQHLSLSTDTLHFNLKKIKVKKPKKVDEKDSIPKIELLNVVIKSSNVQDVYAPIQFTMGEPIDSINTAGIKLEVMRDSVWQSAGAVVLKRDNDYALLNYNIKSDWEPGSEYQLTIDSLAIHSIYGLYNKGIKHTFKVRELEEYSNLFFKVNVTDSAFVELLGTDDKVVRTSPVSKGVAEFMYLMPGVYYARLVLDRNGNGKYDTGNYLRKEQPEEVYYYSKKMNLKKNWDVEQPWDIYGITLDSQKPNEIKKNKPAEKKTDKDKKKGKNPDENLEEEDGGFGTNMFNNPGNPNNKYDQYNRNNQNNRYNNNLRR